jgi:A/G-specific adenine glycosylase
MSDADTYASLIREIESRKASIQRSVVNWGRTNFRRFEWRENRSPYSVLVSEILLKRTTAMAAAHVYSKFMSLYPNLEELAKAQSRDVERLLRKIGYHKRRAKMLIEIANYIQEEFHGKIPASKQDLLEIPNVGYYTANAVLSLGYGTPAAMVDTNIERILCRLFLKHFPKKPRISTVQRIADLISPTINNQDYNYALLDLGGLICRYGSPKCKLCPIRKLCDYYSSSKQRD